VESGGRWRGLPAGCVELVQMPPVFLLHVGVMALLALQGLNVEIRRIEVPGRQGGYFRLKVEGCDGDKNGGART
jgi:hypothetical protein